MRDCLFGVGIAGAALSAIALVPASGEAPTDSSDLASPGGRIESVFGTIQPQIGDDRARPSSQTSNMRLASLPPQITTDSAAAGNERETGTPALAMDRASFDQRFNSLTTERFASFNERFAALSAGGTPGPAQSRDWMAAAAVRLEAPYREKARLALRGTIADAPVETRAAATPQKPMRLAYAPSDVTPDDLRPSILVPSDALPAEQGKRTAIYDISARVLYLPNGDRLEAHSGYGEHMDDLRSVRVRNKGVTPPNVYKLSLREKPFHGVQAVRMTPVEPGKMYGRDGFLVHSYMLGPDGDSNGCVSINDYAKFLNAFLNGDVDRLIVVERLMNPPPAPGGDWLAEQIRSMREAS